MRKPIATLALAAAMATPALSQTAGPRGGTVPPRGFAPPPSTNAEARAATPKADGALLRSGEEVPKTAGEIVAPEANVPVPNVAVDPLLIQPEHGPFMVMAR